MRFSLFESAKLAMCWPSWAPSWQHSCILAPTWLHLGPLNASRGSSWRVAGLLLAILGAILAPIALKASESVEMASCNPLLSRDTICIRSTKSEINVSVISKARMFSECVIRREYPCKVISFYRISFR